MLECDVLVVGAGILGVSSAYHIKNANPEKEVLLIDRLADAGQANTGRSNAMFRNTFTSTDNQILSDASIDFYRHVQDDLRVDVGLDSVGYLWLMSGPQLSRSQGHLKKMERNGVRTRLYSRRELNALIPGLRTEPRGELAQLLGLVDVEAGVFGPKCGRLAPEKLALFYKDSFVRAGGKVMFGKNAARLVIEPGKPLGLDGEPFVWQEHRVVGVRLGDGEDLRAETTVSACGAWNSSLLDPAGVDGHSKAKKRQLFAIDAKGVPELEAMLLTKGFSGSGTLPFVILPKASLFIKAVKESGEFWIGCEDEVNRAFITFPEEDLERYRAEPAYYEYNMQQILREYLPAFGAARPTRMWAGLYSYNTLDNLPYVFQQQGLIVVGGDSGSGIMKGDSLGRVANAVYQHGERAEAELFGGRRYRASKLSFDKRDVEREEWVL